MRERLASLRQEIKPLHDQLANHPLYAAIDSMEKLRVFMEHHVFAVWDFMSLLKSLQRDLTCVDVPWTPKGDAGTRYLINEIVTGEESDVDQRGIRTSHFELYLAAMKQAGCDTTTIDTFIDKIRNSETVEAALSNSGVNRHITDFVRNTFGTIGGNKPHVMAAVFTFGREDMIPGMFISFVKRLNKQTTDQAGIFQYYLERHIEVDGDHHAHLAYDMTEKLCGDNERYWEESAIAVKNALAARIQLWDGIYGLIR